MLHYEPLQTHIRDVLFTAFVDENVIQFGDHIYLFRNKKDTQITYVTIVDQLKWCTIKCQLVVNIRYNPILDCKEPVLTTICSYKRHTDAIDFHDESVQQKLSAINVSLINLMLSRCLQTLSDDERRFTYVCFDCQTEWAPYYVNELYFRLGPSPRFSVEEEWPQAFDNERLYTQSECNIFVQRQLRRWWRAYSTLYDHPINEEPPEEEVVLHEFVDDYHPFVHAFVTDAAYDKSSSLVHLHFPLQEWKDAQTRRSFIKQILTFSPSLLDIHNEFLDVQ